MSEKENKIVDFKEKVVLTESQKLIILEMLNNENAETPKIKEILDRVFPGENLDARSKKGIIVREFIAEKGLDYRAAKEWVVKKDIQLTEEQKQYITNNIKSEKPLQMARVLFNNHNLTNLDSETRAIYSYIKELPSLVKAGSLDKQNYNVEEYKPPKTDDQCISRINQYVDNANFDRAKLTEKQKRDIKNLIGYLHSTRYVLQIQTYALEEDRRLFESSFIRCTYNRDLEEQEVDQYIMYATEVVSGKQIAKRIEQFEKQQDETLEETGKANMGMVEAVKVLRTDLHQCITRQRQLLKALEGERQKRMESQKEDNTSILDLLSYWKDYERRQHLLKLADIRESQLKDEIERLKNLDEVKLEIFGISERELIGQ
jgi:hypothetical protein